MTTDSDESKHARYRTREEINASGYEAICIPGPESLLPYDCRGHDHVPGAHAAMPADPG